MDGKMKQWTNESFNSLKLCPISVKVLIQSWKHFKLSMRHCGFRSASLGSKHVDAGPNFSRGAGGTERGLRQDWWDESHTSPFFFLFYRHVSEDIWVFATLFTALLLHDIYPSTWHQPWYWLMPSAWVYIMHIMTWCHVRLIRLWLSIFLQYFFQMFTNQFPYKDQQDQCWGTPLLNLLLLRLLFFSFSWDLYPKVLLWIQTHFIKGELPSLGIFQSKQYFSKVLLPKLVVKKRSLFLNTQKSWTYDFC